MCFFNKGDTCSTLSSKIWCLMFSWLYLVSRVILWTLKNFAVSWLLRGITRRWVIVCFQPCYNPLWLTGLKTPTNYLTKLISVRERSNGEQSRSLSILSYWFRQKEQSVSFNVIQSLRLWKQPKRIYGLIKSGGRKVISVGNCSLEVSHCSVQSKRFSLDRRYIF